jgi:hypothetical protein
MFDRVECGMEHDFGPPPPRMPRNYPPPIGPVPDPGKTVADEVRKLAVEAMWFVAKGGVR